MPTLKDKLNPKKLLENAAKIMESEQYVRMEDRVFKFAGVTPYEKECRDHIDWLYLLLWISSIGYQFLIFLCLFFFPLPWFSDLLGIFYDPYFIAITGYGIFNIVHRYHPVERRCKSIEHETERRKKRNGHRFIGYWWLNFLTILGSTFFFNYPRDLSGPLGISLKIALASSAIGFGYTIAKKKLSDQAPQ